MVRNVIIIGAAGRDFHNFNMFFRRNSEYRVVAFTATQIPGIDNRKYPSELAGALYPNGIPIYSQEELPNLIKSLNAHDCIFSYSDISYVELMNISSLVMSSGSNLILLGPNETMLKSSKPVIAVGAIRTGCGKSQTSRRIIEILMNKGFKVVVVRHPMAYGDLVSQKVQRFASVDDLAKHNCTIEEMEEYEPHINRGNVIYAGVDYEAILHAAENDPDGCDFILWEGGNNDFSFYRTDLYVCVADPLRAGHEVGYFPGEVVARMADVIVLNKIDSASLNDINTVRNNLRKINPSAIVIDAASPISVNKPEIIKRSRVLVIEDGPTLTHGEMKIGAGIVAAMKYGASEIVDPRQYATGSIKEVFTLYPETGTILPAMGYGKQQIKDLETTVNNTPCDAVIIATPIDLNRVVKINKPTVKIQYELQEIGKPTFDDVIADFIAKLKTKKKLQST